MATSIDISAKLSEERRAYGVWLASHKTDAGYDLSGDQVDEFHRRDEALQALQKQYEDALVIEKSAAENEAKLASTGRMIKPEIAEPESKLIRDPEKAERAMTAAFKKAEPTLLAMSKGERGTVRFELPIETKTLVDLSMHYPLPTRAPTTGMALYYNDVEDLFAHGTTNANSIQYFIQTTDTESQAFVAEGSAATDSAYAWSVVNDEVETVQAWIPVTREFLADNEGMQSMITARLADQLQKTVSKELMYGTGTTPHLWGVTVRTNFASQAKGTDPVFDCFLKAIDDVAVAGDATPDAIVIHPTDYMSMVLTRTTEGVYILGNPGNPIGTPTLWGLPVRVTTTCAAAAGTACVGAFRTMAMVMNNGGLVIEASTEHSTYFTERKVAIALSRRLSAINFRPTAFSKVTGL